MKNILWTEKPVCRQERILSPHSALSSSLRAVGKGLLIPLPLYFSLFGFREFLK